jgi:hypothetical protein
MRRDAGNPDWIAKPARHVMRGLPEDRLVSDTRASDDKVNQQIAEHPRRDPSAIREKSKLHRKSEAGGFYEAK